MYINNVGYYIKDFHYSLYELLDRYRSKRLIFPDLHLGSHKKREFAKESIDALLYGIPYPKVYLSELQNGKFLVLETEHRLRCLLDYLLGKFEIEVTRFFSGNQNWGDNSFSFLSKQLFFADLSSKDQKDILRTKIQVSILEYRMPLYAHMKIGSYIKKWSVTEEESVRKILYADKGIGELQTAMISQLGLKANPKSISELRLEADYTVFLTYLFFFKNAYYSQLEGDKYYLQDLMFSNMNEIMPMVYSVAKPFFWMREALLGSKSNKMNLPDSKSQLRRFEFRFPQFEPAAGHLLGIAVCLCDDIHDVKKILDIVKKIIDIACSSDDNDRYIKNLFKYCDLSGTAIELILKELRYLIND